MALHTKSRMVPLGDHKLLAHSPDENMRGQGMMKLNPGTREGDRRQTEDEIARENLGPRGVVRTENQILQYW